MACIIIRGRPSLMKRGIPIVVPVSLALWSFSLGWTIPLDSVLGFPSLAKTFWVAEGRLEKWTLSRDTLKWTSRTSKSVHRPVMWRERFPPRTFFVSAEFDFRTPEPPIRELMLRRGFFAQLAMKRFCVDISISIVYFLPIHIGMWLKSAALWYYYPLLMNEWIGI